MQNETTAQFIARLEEVNRRKAALVDALTKTIKDPAQERVRLDFWHGEGRNFTLEVNDRGDETANRSLVERINRLAKELDAALEELRKDLQPVEGEDE
jgi:hypothetical protein